MAGKDTDIIITVGAEADEQSAKKATKDLVKGVLSSLEGGYIPVPVELKTPIKGASKELKTAQEEVVAQWEKTFSKGFSSSKKNLDDLTSAYQKFKRLAGAERKTSSKQYRGIFHMMDNQVKDYKVKRKEIKAVQPKETKVTQTKNIKTTPTNIAKRRNKNSGIGAIKRELSYPTQSLDTSTTTPIMMKISDRQGGHRNRFNEQNYRSLAEERKNEKRSLKTRFIKQEDADKLLIKGFALARNALSDTAANKGLSEISAKKVMEIIGKVLSEKMKNADFLEKAPEYIKEIFAYNEKAGKSTADSIRDAVNATFGRFFNTSGYIGLAYDNPKDADLDNEAVSKFIKQLFRGINRVKDVKNKYGMTALEEQALKNLATIDYDAQYKEISIRMAKYIIDPLNEALAKFMPTPDTAIDSKSAVVNAITEGMAEEKDENGSTVASKLSEVNELVDNTNDIITKELSATKKVAKGQETEITSLASKVDEVLTQGDFSGGQYPYQRALFAMLTCLNIIRDKVTEISERKGWRSWWPVAVGGGGNGGNNGNGKNEPPEGISNLPSTTVNGIQTSAQTLVESVAKAKKILKTDEFEASIAKSRSKIQKAFEGMFSFRRKANAAQVMAMNREEQNRMRQERINKFGFSEDGTGTGDKLRIARRKQLYGFKGGLLKDDVDKIFENIKLTNGIGPIDTSGITEALEDAIRKNMFTMRTGGLANNIMGPMTLYAGQDSLEKTRAQIDGLNMVLSKIRNAALEVLANIQNREGVLSQYEQSGEARFHNGVITADSSDEAKTAFAQLENAKAELRSILADLAAMNQLVEINKGNVKGVVKDVSFLSPSLMKYNKIIQNINAGLDYQGKVLKHQTRFGEVMEGAFKRVQRSVEQMLRNWILMLNPFNLIKQAFQDFMSYDVKFKRTMNVIKYNLRAIIRPAMSWIAQQIVNIIGLVNALMKGIGKTFGKNWDLFDQEAANAEKMREELEEAANVTAAFDELHDIGGDSSNDASMDLTGDIYKPEWEDLYKSIEEFGMKIGDVLKGIKDFFSGFNFWDWLIIAGAALLGLMALKWLIGLFSNKNPLQSVADGFAYLEKMVGWAILIWAFTEFTKALTAFVECMKTADWDDIAKALIMLGGAFAILVGSIWGLEKMTAFFGTTPGALVGLAALVLVFGLFVQALVPFIECIRDLGDEKVEVIAASLITLALAFVELIAGVAGMEWLTKLIGLDWTALFGLAAVVGVFSAFVAALVPFIEVISNIPSGEKIETIVATFGALVSAFLALAIGVSTVSKAFTAMDWKAIGQLAVVTIIFSLFTGVLVLFVKALKDVPFETLAGGALLIAAAFLSLGGAIAFMVPVMSALKFTAFLELVGLLLVMAGMLYVLQEFVHSLQDLTTEQLMTGLIFLAGSLAAITAAIIALAIAFTALVTTGIGAIAVVLVAVVVAAIALLIYSLADLVRALGEAGDGIKKILEGVSNVVLSVGAVIVASILATGAAISNVVTSITDGISNIITSVADGVSNIVTSMAEGIRTILDGIVEVITAVGEQLCNIVTVIADTITAIVTVVSDNILAIMEVIIDFIDDVIEKVISLAETIVHEVGETIRTVVETVGQVVLGIIQAIMDIVPVLLNSIISFINQLGPAIEGFVDSAIRSVTKLVNFIVSAVEYIINLAVAGVNGVISAVNGLTEYVGISIPRVSPVSIPRFVPKYELGTNYVPSDGFAYLHQGEAVIPKKYNQPYTPTDNSSEAIGEMTTEITRLRELLDKGINVSGEFKQRGSDLVAVVEKGKNKNGRQVLSNPAYAR